MTKRNYNPNPSDQFLGYLGDTTQEQRVAISDLIKLIFGANININGTLTVKNIVTGDGDVSAPAVTLGNPAQQIGFIRVDDQTFYAVIGGVAVASFSTDPQAGVSVDSLTVNGVADSGNGRLTLQSISAVQDLSTGTTIRIQIPANVKIVGTSLLVNEDIHFGSDGATWGARYTIGASQSIASSANDPAAGTTVDTFFNSNAASDITGDVTDILISPNSGSITSGTITAVTYYYEITSLPF